MQHDKRPKGWNHTNRKATSDGTTHHHTGNKTKNEVKSWPSWSWLLRCGGARPQVQGQQQWELLTPASTHWDEVPQLHSLTAARTRATPDPNKCWAAPRFSGGNRALVRALDVRGSHWAAASECEEHYSSQTLPTARAEQLRAPEWQHTGTKWVVGEPERDGPASTAPDSDFPAYPFAPVNMSVPPSPGTKKDKGSKR